LKSPSKSGGLHPSGDIRRIAKHLAGRLHHHGPVVATRASLDMHIDVFDAVSFRDLHSAQSPVDP
jgi:hypothetical protein